MSLWEVFFGLTEQTKKKHPHLAYQTNIDRHKCTRQVPMQVLSLGMGRTGTASMKQALAILGYPTAHGFDLHTNPLDGPMWMEAFEAKYFGDKSLDLNKPDFWDRLLGHVSAVTDLPHNCFGPELINAYPDAKVILVERDVDTWFPSFEGTVIFPQDHPLMIKAIAPFDSSGKMKLLNPVVQKGVMQGQFASADSQEWRRKAKAVYKQHYAEIGEILEGQPERLLEYRLGSGWEPLCEFLGKDIPEMEFPRTNEGAMHDEMGKVIGVQLLRSAIWTLTIWTAPVWLSMIVWRYWPVVSQKWSSRIA